MSSWKSGAQERGLAGYGVCLQLLEAVTEPRGSRMLSRGCGERGDKDRDTTLLSA